MSQSFHIHVSWPVIAWAIENGEQTDQQLLKFPLAKWQHPESEKDYPTFNELRNFSKTTHIPFDYLLRNEQPKEPHPFVKYRTINNINVQPSRRLIDTMNEMENCQAWMKEQLIKNNQATSFKLNGKIDQNMNHEEAAKKVSSLLGLTLPEKRHKTDDGFFNLLKARMARLNILVMQNGVVGNNTHRKLDLNEFRAFVLNDDVVPLIFINSQDTKKARIFSLIHEFIHLLLGQNEILNVSPSSDLKTERWINSVTSAFLLPKTAVSTKTTYNSELIEKLATRTHLSLLATTIRLHHLKVVPEAKIEWAKHEQEEALQKLSASKASGGNYYNTINSRLDKNYANAVISAESSGNLSLLDAARMLGTSLKSYKRSVNTILGLE